MAESHAGSIHYSKMKLNTSSPTSKFKIQEAAEKLLHRASSTMLMRQFTPNRMHAGPARPRVFHLGAVCRSTGSSRRAGWIQALTRCFVTLKSHSKKRRRGGQKAQTDGRTCRADLYYICSMREGGWGGGLMGGG